MIKITERVAGTHLKIQKDRYRQAARYMAVTLPLAEEFKQEYAKGEMVRIGAAFPIHVRDAVVAVEVNPALLDAGFCSYQRIVDPEKGEYTPDVLVRLKEDLDLTEADYLFKLYVQDTW